MAVPSEAYIYGTQIALLMLIMFVVVVVINYVFIPVFYHNHLANCYEYLELRFGKSIKNLATTLYVTNVLLVLPVTLFIPALALAQVTSINLHIINTVCVCVCVIYTMLVSYKIERDHYLSFNPQTEMLSRNSTFRAESKQSCGRMSFKQQLCSAPQH